MDTKKGAGNFMKWCWWDLFIFIGGVCLLGALGLRLGICESLFFITVAAVVYDSTIKRIWMKISPDSYK
jgi:hypothetical protein